MKKIVVAILISFSTILFACSQNTTTTDESVSMANPMVPVESEKEFKDVLGITFRTSVLPQNNFSQFIISKKIGDARFTVKNANGEDIKCMFRCTKDKEAAKQLSGIYDQDLKQTNTMTYGFLDIRTFIAPNEGYYIYYFTSNNVYYELSTKGQLDDTTLETTLRDCLRCADLAL